jgi:hypothetical protein
MSRTHSRNILVCFVLAFGVLGGATTTGTGQQVVPVRSDTSPRLFRERVAAYAQLRSEIIADLLKIGIDPKADEGRRFREMLTVAIRAARRHSQPGEIFCPEVAGRMREMVWTALLNQGDILSDVPMVEAVRVNDFYPEGEPFATVPPLLLQQFDPLPSELQYRFLANSLILLDIDTALIVDFIPNAFDRS